MEKIQRILFSLGIIILLIIVFFFVTQVITKYTGYAVSGGESSFDACLKTKDITLYINSDNPSIVLSNIQINSVLDSVKIKNCYRDKEYCVSKGIDFYPSWIVNGNVIKGDITKTDLTKYSGCK